MMQIKDLIQIEGPQENIIKKILFSSNLKLISSVLILTSIGLLMILSATYYTGNYSFFTKQLIAFSIGIAILLIFTIINYEFFKEYYFYLYIFCVILLILVLIFGTVYRNTKAWLNFYIFTIQPSEIVRILFILSLAGYLDKTYNNQEKFSRIFFSSLMFLIICLFLLLQPDFSAIIIYLPIILSMFYLACVNRKIMFFSILFGVLFIFLSLTKFYLTINLENLSKLGKLFYTSLSSFNLYWFVTFLFLSILSYSIWWFLRKLLFNIPLFYLILTVLIIFLSFSGTILIDKLIKPYQQKRIIAFLNPNFDPTGAGYQVIQSKIAIGSGKIFGKGLFQSTQAKLGFIPEKHTDFIFSLLAEELGFFGSLVVLFLYLIIILEGINITKTSRDTYGSLVACGITSMFSFYLFMNLGMCLGVLPVVGLPLPFISYGGSNLISSYLAVGILNSIHIRRYIY